MKTFIVATLACLAFAAAVRISPREAVFTPQREYLYKYETQVLNGIPANSQLFSGLKIKADARVQIRVGHQWVLQLENIRVMKLNRELPESMTPEKMIPSEMFSELSSEHEKVYQTQLSRPVKFIWQNGKVTELFVSHEEPEWSANMKRGVINMFVVKTEKPSEDSEQYKYKSLFSSSSSSSGSSSSESKSLELEDLKTELSSMEEHDSSADSFTTMERGIDGECETVYNVQEEQKVIKISKVRNYESCRSSPRWQTGVLSHLNTTFCNKECQQRLIKRFSATEITLLGDKTNFGIERVDVFSKLWATPFTMEKGSFEAFTKQELTLIKTHEFSKKIDIESGLSLRSLEMYIPTSSVSSIKHDEKAHDKLEIVEQLLEKLIPLCTPHISMEAAPIVARLSTVLKSLPTPHIVTLIEKYTQRNEEKTSSLKKELLLDIIPTLKHQNIDKILKEVLQKRLISATRASLWINMMSLTSPSTPELIHTLIDLYENVRTSESKLLKHAAILTAGSLTNKLVASIERENLPKREMQPKIESIVKKIKSLLSRCRDIHQKTLIMKSIGNMGLVQFVPELSRAIRDRSQPTAVRVSAISALRKVAVYFPRKVQSILMPVYMNRQENAQVRLTSFVVMMNSRPSTGLVQMLAQRLHRESNRQVSSFVYSYFKSFSQTTNPCLSKLAKKCRQALLSIRPVEETMQFSKNFHFDYFLKSVQVGDMIDLITIDSMTSVLPETILAKWSSIFMNQNTEVIEAGLNIKGLKTIFSNLFGSNGLLKKIISGKAGLREILKPIFQQGHYKMYSEIKNIADSLKINDRLSETMDTTAYLKVFGNHIMAMSAEARDFSDFLQIVKKYLPKTMEHVQKGYEVNMLKTLSIIDSSYNLPTPVGLPVGLNLSVVALGRIDGRIQVEGLPSAEELINIVSGIEGTGSNSKENRESFIKMANFITTKINTEPSMMISTRTSFGCNAFLVKSTTEVEGNVLIKVPTKIFSKIDTRTGEMETEIELPQTEMEIVHASLKPLSIIRTFPVTPKSEVFVEDIKEHSIKQRLFRQIPFEFETLEKAIGMKVVIKGKTITPRTVNVPCLLFGRHELRITVRPGNNMPKKIQIKTQYESDKQGQLHAMYSRFTSGSQESQEKSWEPRPMSSQEDSNERNWKSINWSNDKESREFSSRISRSNSQSGESRQLSSEEILRMSRESNSNSKRFDDASKSDEELNEILSKSKSFEQASFGSYRTKSREEPERLAMSNANMKIDQRIRSPISRKMNVVVRTVGNSQERFVRMTCQYIHSEDLMQHQINMEIVHTPLTREQSSTKKMLIRSFTELPKALFWTRPSEELSKKTPICETELFYGPESKPEKIVDLKIVYGEKLSQQITRKYEINTPLKLTTKIQFGDKTYESIERIAKIVKETIKRSPSLFNFLRVDNIFERNQRNQINLILAPITELKQLIVAIETPEETIVVKGMPFVYVPLTDEMTPKTPILKSVFHAATGGRFNHEECRLQNNRVYNFNQQKYEVPETDCEMVVAKDCSRNKLFALTVKKISEGKRIVKLLVAGSKIEISPASHNSPIKVKVDNREVRLTPGHQMTIRAKHNQETFEIKMTEEKYITISGMGLTLNTNCETINFRVSSEFRGQTCGVCGSYSTNERQFLGPHKEVYRNPEQMAASYVIKSETCNANRLMQEYRIVDTQKEHSQRMSDRCERVRRHAVVEREVEGEKKICISTESFESCSPECRSRNSETRPMPFHCLPANDWRSRWIAEQAEQKPMFRLSGKKHHLFADVSVPKQCVPRY